MAPETKLPLKTAVDPSRIATATSGPQQQQRNRASTLNGNRRMAAASKSAPEGSAGQQKRTTGPSSTSSTSSTSSRGRCSSAQVAHARRSQAANDRERADAKGARLAASAVGRFVARALSGKALENSHAVPLPFRGDRVTGRRLIYAGRLRRSIVSC